MNNFVIRKQAEEIMEMGHTSGTKAIMGLVNKTVENELWDLYEYMGQFPDDLNLAMMYERIKCIIGE